MVYECYLDDSKDKNQKLAYVCAGFWGSPKAWGKFEKTWKRQLDKDGIAYYKTSECHSLTGPFAKFKLLPKPYGREAAQAVKKRLADIMVGSSGLFGIGAVVPVGDHKQVLKHESADKIYPAKYIYHRAFEFTLLGAVRQACKTEDASITFVHDDGSDYDKLRALYRSFIEKNHLSGSRMKGFIPLDDKQTPALQVADMFANAIMETSSKFFSDQSLPPPKEVFMLNNRSRVFVWSKEIGEKILAANMGRRNVPIPESLAKAIMKNGIDSTV